jgi:subtilisin family serine protease
VRLLAGLIILGLVAAALPAQAAPSGQGVSVAVLDSGVDGNHPELRGRVERVYSPPFAPGIPLGPSQLLADPNGQGTAVASLIAGTTLGVAPQARILDLQVSATYTGTALDPAAEASAIEAMDYLLQHPERAQVAILSFASRGVSTAGAETLASQAKQLSEKGVLVIVPASPSLSALHASPAVLTVGAPNCGSGHQSGEAQPRKPDLVATSDNLRAAQPGTPTNAGPTASVSGTAYAAALAAGAAALMLDAHHGLPVDASASILRDSSADLGDPGPDDCNGFGLLSPQGAVAATDSWVDPQTVYPTKPTPAPLWLAVLGLGAAAAVMRRRA